METLHVNEITLHGRVAQAPRLIDRRDLPWLPDNHGRPCLVFEVWDLAVVRQKHLCVATGSRAATLAPRLRSKDRVTVRGRLRTLPHPDFLQYRGFVEVDVAEENVLTPWQLRDYCQQNHSLRLTGRVAEIECHAASLFGEAGAFAVLETRTVRGRRPATDLHRVSISSRRATSQPAPAFPGVGDVLSLTGEVSHDPSWGFDSLLPAGTIVHAEEWAVLASACSRVAEVEALPDESVAGGRAAASEI
jgi:hypothetical protein